MTPPADTDTRAIAWELRLTAGSSNKFYRQFVAGTALITHHGRIGTAGQVHLHIHPSPAACHAHALAKCAEKERKGYWSHTPPQQVDLGPTTADHVAAGHAPAPDALDAALAAGSAVAA